MNSIAHPQGACPCSSRSAAFLLDEHGTVRQCTATVYGLLGRTAGEIEGRPMADICTAPASWDDWTGRTGEREFGAVLRHRNGTPVEADVEVVPLSSGGPEGPTPTGGLEPAEGPAGLLVFATAALGGRRGEQDREHGRNRDRALVHALFTQNRVGLVIRDPDPSAQRVTLNPGFFSPDQPDQPYELDQSYLLYQPDRPPDQPDQPDRPPDQPGHPHDCHPHDCDHHEMRLRDLLVAKDGDALDQQLLRVLETGEPLLGWEHSARRRDVPRRERTVSMSAFRLGDPRGNGLGVAAVLTDVTEQKVAQRLLALMYAAAHRLGRSLDVTRNAEDVLQLLVPDFADLACVDLSEPVGQGGDASSFPGSPLLRVAVASADGAWPADIYQLGDTVRAPDDVGSHTMSGGRTVMMPDLAAVWPRPGSDPAWLRLVYPASAASAMFVPLFARGQVLGILNLWRGRDRLPYAAGDVRVAQAIASRAALSLDNARRYTREHRTVEKLQRGLLPPRVMRTPTAETSSTYAPASSAAGTGGIWYDVIGLSGVRTAFVVGKVVGHGMHAAGAMGRLRSTVRTLADLDLPPEELPSHLADLVTRATEDEGHQPASVAGSLHGATCLYVTYDPVTGQCLVAAAGHPAPLVARRHTGTVNEVRVHPGPALGLGGGPFETAQLLLQPGDVLAVHSGLPAGDGPGAVEDLRQLSDSALSAARTDTPLPEITERLLNAVRAKPRAEDLALLLARVDRVPASLTAFWQLSADPDQVAHARALASAQLTEWDLTDMAFSTELVVSELVTNAIRYAGGPIGLRLVKDRKLIIEVSDPSQSQPHLRRARLSDEGGRGLFLVARLTDRWGSRYTTEGKTIWTEQLYETGEVTWIDEDL